MAQNTTYEILDNLTRTTVENIIVFEGDTQWLDSQFGVGNWRQSASHDADTLPELPSKGELLADLASHRHDAEVAGYKGTLKDGTPVTVHTDRISQSSNETNYNRIKDGTRPDIAAFKFKEGIMAVSNADLEPLLMGAIGYVQHCFDAELFVTERIHKGTIEDEGVIKALFNTELAAAMHK